MSLNNEIISQQEEINRLLDAVLQLQKKVQYLEKFTGCFDEEEEEEPYVELAAGKKKGKPAKFDIDDIDEDRDDDDDSIYVIVRRPKAVKPKPGTTKIKSLLYWNQNSYQWVFDVEDATKYPSMTAARYRLEEELAIPANDQAYMKPTVVPA